MAETVGSIIKIEGTDGLEPGIVEKLNYNFEQLVKSIDQAGLRIVMNDVDNAIDQAQRAGVAADTAYTFASDAKAFAEDARDSAHAANDALDGMRAAAEAADTTLTGIYQKAVDAERESLAAQGSAVQAEANASAAATSAGQAAESATAAQGDAFQAKVSADNAYSSALQANGYAIGALMGLDTLQDVIGYLNWMDQYGEWIQTTDTEIIPNRQYWLPDSSGKYVPAVVPEWTYALTEDVAIDPSKTYYVQVADGYEPVEEPDVADIGSYYERFASSPAALGYYVINKNSGLANFVSSHITLLNDGLHITQDGSSHQAKIDADSFDIIDPTGRVVSSLGAVEAVIGAVSDLHMSARGDRLSFWSAEYYYEKAVSEAIAQDPNYQVTSDKALPGEVAYIASDATGNSVFYMNRAVVVSELRFAKWTWLPRKNDNLSLKWMGE